MRCFRAIPLFVLLSACASSVRAPQYASKEQDPQYQQVKAIVNAVISCYRKEAESPSLRAVDLDTAALAVFGRCATERQRHKVFSAGHTIESVPQFETRWRMEEQDDMAFIKQMLAMIRTGR